jgi:diadenosine tetraphosphate (Ap4A) HIT family hydrolase
MPPGFRDYIAAPHKLAYVEGKERRLVPCIFCAIIQGDSRIPTKLVYRDAKFMILINTFPFTPGHLMVVPLRHVEKLSELDRETLTEFFWMGVKTVQLVEAAFHPVGLNVGLNLGEAAGASITHLHLHVVPRYPRELGFMETVGDTRTLVMDADTVYQRLQPHLHLLKDANATPVKKKPQDKTR